MRISLIFFNSWEWDYNKNYFFILRVYCEYDLLKRCVTSLHLEIHRHTSSTGNIDSTIFILSEENMFNKWKSAFLTTHYWITYILYVLYYLLLFLFFQMLNIIPKIVIWFNTIQKNTICIGLKKLSKHYCSVSKFIFIRSCSCFIEIRRTLELF